MKRTSFEGDQCPIARSLDVIGDWWSLLIIRDASLGRRRFGEFQKSLGLAKNILTVRLRALVDQGILKTAPAPSDGSAHQEYVLTAKGRGIFPIPGRAAAVERGVRCEAGGNRDHSGGPRKGKAGAQARALFPGRAAADISRHGTQTAAGWKTRAKRGGLEGSRDCPTGKSLKTCPALRAKIFPLARVGQISGFSPRVSPDKRGGSRSSRIRGGMRWTCRCCD